MDSLLNLQELDEKKPKTNPESFDKILIGGWDSYLKLRVRVVHMADIFPKRTHTHTKPL